MAESSHLNRYCHGSDTAQSTKRCNAPGRTFANWSSSLQAFCPFGKVPCNITHSLVLDSGMVDSHIHLGINARPEDRVAFRKSLTCSVIKQADYKRRFDASNVTTAFPLFSNSTQTYPSLLSNETYFFSYDFGNSTFDEINTTYLWDSSSRAQLYSGPPSGKGPVYTLQ